MPYDSAQAVRLRAHLGCAERVPHARHGTDDATIERACADVPVLVVPDWYVPAGPGGADLVFDTDLGTALTTRFETDGLILAHWTAAKMRLSAEYPEVPDQFHGFFLDLDAHQGLPPDDLLAFLAGDSLDWPHRSGAPVPTVLWERRAGCAIGYTFARPILDRVEFEGRLKTLFRLIEQEILRSALFEAEQVPVYDRLKLDDKVLLRTSLHRLPRVIRTDKPYNGHGARVVLLNEERLDPMTIPVAAPDDGDEPEEDDEPEDALARVRRRARWDQDLPRERYEAYALAALRGECEDLAGLDDGRRDQLFKSACRLGRFVGAELLDEDDVTDALEDAADSAGMRDRNYIGSAIRNGLRWGTAHPWVPDEDRDGEEEVR